jgi:adenine-specific DNA-methyltransferase
VLSGETLPSYEALGAALFHMATSHALDAAKVRETDFYLGGAAGQYVWLIYKPDLDWLKSPEAALTLARAKQFAATAPDMRHLVIAPARFVSQKMLTEQNVPVDFVPLPFALYRIDRSCAMYRQLDYQDRVIAALDAYLDLLKAKKAKAIGANKPPREL